MIRHFGSARGFCAAGVLCVAGGFALADAPGLEAIPLADDADLVAVDIEVEANEAEEVDVVFTIGEEGDPSVPDLMGPTDILADGGPDYVIEDTDCIDCVYPSLAPTELAAETAGPAPAMPLIGTNRHEPAIKVAARAPRNICTEADLYVAWLCAWQGFPQP